MSNIKYIEKDLFEGIKDHKDCVIFIPHITNNIKKWGAGFVLPLAKHFPEARRAFFSLNNPKLGEVQFVSCDPLLVDIEKKIFCDLQHVCSRWNL